MNDYKRYSTELIEYYKSKSDNIQKSKRSKSNSNKYSNKSNSNINRSSGKISELDSTSGFKYIIAKTFIDFPETDNEVEI